MDAATLHEISMSPLQQPPTLLSKVEVLDVIQYAENEHVYNTVANGKKVSLKMFLSHQPDLEYQCLVYEHLHELNMNGTVFPRYFGCYLVGNSTNIRSNNADFPPKLRYGLGLEVLQPAKLTFTEYFATCSKEYEEALVAGLQVSLRCLHNAGVAHGQVCADNILMYQNNKGLTSVKLVNPSNSTLQKFSFPEGWIKAVNDDKAALVTMLNQVHAVKEAQKAHLLMKSCTFKDLQTPTVQAKLAASLSTLGVIPAAASIRATITGLVPTPFPPLALALIKSFRTAQPPQTERALELIGNMLASYQDGPGGEDVRNVALLREQHALLLQGVNKMDEALGEWEGAYTMLRAKFGVVDESCGQVRSRFVRFSVRVGQAEKAESVLLRDLGQLIVGVLQSQKDGGRGHGSRKGWKAFVKTYREMLGFLSVVGLKDSEAKKGGEVAREVVESMARVKLEMMLPGVLQCVAAGLNIWGVEEVGKEVEMRESTKRNELDEDGAPEVVDGRGEAKIQLTKKGDALAEGDAMTKGDAQKGTINFEGEKRVTRRPKKTGNRRASS